MKADPFGARSDRVRFDYGWLGARQCKAESVPDDERCWKCAHGQTGDGTAWYCNKLKVTTARLAACIEWEAQDTVHGTAEIFWGSAE